MEPFVKLFVLLFASISVTLAVPVQHNTQWQTLTSGQQCARRCGSDPRFLNYQSGKTYYYQFQTDTLLDSQQPISLEGAVVISAVGQCDLVLQLERMRIQGVSEATALEMQMALEERPLHFGYSDGQVTDVCVSQEDKPWTLNVKKAIVSALQMSSSSLTQETRVHETDLQGACVTTYQPISERFGKHVIRKIKNFAECDDRQQWLSGLFPRAYSRLNQIPITSGQQECVQSIEADILFGVTCHEEQRVLANRALIKSQMNLRFERQLDQLVIDNKRFQYQRHYNHLKMSSHEESENENQLEPTLRQLCQQLSQKSSQTSEQFSRLIRILRKTSQQHIQQIFAKIQDICPQNRQPIEDLFLDACAHSGSVGSIKVIQQWLQKNHNKKNSIRSQTLFHNLAFVSQPQQQSLPILVDILRENSDQSQVVLGVSAYFHNAKHVTSQSSQSQEYKENEKKVVNELLRKVKTNSNEFEKTIAIKALQNIGLESQPEVRQQLAQLAQQQQSPEGVRVAALKALSEAMNGSQERPLVVSIVQNEKNSNEIRMNAIKALLMSGSSQQEMQRIKQSVDKSNQNIKQYARSLVQNLQETSDPHKKDIYRQIASQEWTSAKPENKWFGISNNFETSFMVDALGVGAVLESDVIYEENRRAPSSVVINATLPLMGREVNLIEVELRQKGLDEIVEKKIQEIYREVKEKNSRQLVDSLLAMASQWQQEVHQSQAFIEVSVKVDGKTIFVYNSQHNHNQKSIRQMLSQWSLEGAFAFQPINTRLRIPSGNGFPIEARINSTIVTSFNNNNNKQGVNSPFIVWQTETGIQVLAQQEKRQVGVAFTVQSAPSWKSIVDYSQNRFQMKISIPEQRISLLKTKAEVRSGSGSQGLYTGNSYQRCSEWTKKAFGIQLCFEKNSKEMEIFVKKTDSFEDFDLKIERNSEKIQVLMNTPNSQVDRHWEAEVEMQPNGSSGQQKAVKVALRSPWMRVTGSGQLRADEKEQSLTIEMQRNAEKVVFVDLALEQMARGQKREFRPRVQLTWMNKDVIKVGGSVSVAKGRKNQLMINLEGNQKQFLKGSLVREGDRKSADIRVSSDLSLHLLNGLEVKINALFDKSPKHVTADLQVDYRGQKSSRKESMKTSIKLQSIGQSATAQKLSAFGEVTSTQFPELNCHLAYNLLNKAKEHVENELTVQWSRELSRKVHVLQVTKVTANQRAETTINVEVTPWGVDYELRANGEQEAQQVTAQVSGKDRTGNNSKYDFKANVQYKHVSRAPLHLTLSADLKTSSAEWKYSDELREQSSGEYRGQTSVQWSRNGEPLKMAKMDYDYKKKNGNDHQMELQISSPMTQKPIKHSALLRMSRHETHVKSKLLVGDKLHHHVETLLTNQGPSRVQVEYEGYRVKGHAHPYELPQRAGLEVMTPSQLIHKTDIELVPENSFRLKSDTKRQNANIFALESEIHRSKPSKVIFNSIPFEGKVDFRSGSDGHSAEVHLNHLLNDWTHSSAVKAVPQQKTIEIQSKTISKGKPLMVLDSVYNNRQNKVNFLLPAKKTSVLFDSTSGLRNQRSAKLEVNCGQNFRHLSEYANEEPEVHRFESTQTDFRSGSPLYQLQYKKNNNVHQLNGHYLQNYLLDSELKPWDQFGDRQGSAFVNLKNKRSQFEHNSKLAYDNSIIKIESQTRKSNQNLAEIEGQLSRQESQLKIKLPRAQTRAHLIVTPSSGAKIQYSAPNADHVTALEWAGPHYACDSKTTLGNHVTYAVVGNHYPDRKSFISVKTPNYDVSGHVDRAWDTPSAKLTVITPRTSHVTEVSANRNRKSIRIESRADRKSGPEVSESIYNLDGNYNHLDAVVPSNFGLKIAKNWKINGKVQPFGQNKFISVSADHPQYSHVTDLSVNGEKHVIIKSRTQDPNGRNLAKIDSFLPLNQFNTEKSHVILVSPQLDTSLECDPQRQLQFQYRDPKWNHKTIISKDLSSILSNTKLNGNQYFDLNGQLDSSSVANQRSAKITIKTPSIGHQTQVIKSQNNFQLHSNTEYENQLLNKIAFDSQKQLNLEIPQFSAQTQWSRDGATVDYHSRLPAGRHVLASIRMPRDQNQFGVDVAWDQQRDPNQRLKVDWEQREQNSRAIHVLRAEYAGNELRVESDVQKRNVLYGPNTWSVKYSPKYNKERDEMEVRVNHVISEGKQMECHVTYLEGQKQKLDAKVTSKWEPEMVSVEVESTSASNADLNLKVDFKTRFEALKSRNAKISSEIRIQRNAKQYAMEWRVTRAQQEAELDGVKGEMSVETPSGGRQEMDFRLGVKQQEVQFTAKSKDRKLLEVSARADNERSEEKHVQFDLKSNIRDIPSVSVSGDYFRSKQISFKAEVDGERKAEVSLIRTGSDIHSGSQVSLRAETSFWPKFETLLSLKKNSEEIDFEINTKINAKEVLSAIVKGKRSTSGVWTGQARLSDNGSQLAQLEAESTSGASADQFRYELKGNSRRNRMFGAIRVLFSVERNRKTGNRVKVNACEETENTCFDANALWKRKQNELPERVELSVQKNGKSFQLKTSFDEQIEDHSSGQSLLGLTSGRVTDKKRNEMFVAVNGHQMGAEMTSTKRGSQGREHVLRLEFPSKQEMTLKSDFLYQSGSYTSKTQLMDNSKQEVILETEVEAIETEKDFRLRAEAKSEKFKSKNKNKKIEFWFQKPSRELKVDFRSKLVISVGQQPITVESSVDRKQIQQQYRRQGRSLWNPSSALNNTFEFRISDQKRIDFELNAHASPMTAGVAIENRNRRGEKRFAHLFVQSEPSSGEEQRFQAIASTNQKRYRVDGAWLNSEVKLEILNEKSGEKSEKRVAVKGKCLEWESRDQQPEGRQKKYDLCFNYDNKNDESLQLSLEETGSGGQSRQLNANLELDSRGQQSVKIDVTWTPQLLQQWLEQIKEWYQSGNGSGDYYTEILAEIGEEVIEKSTILYYAFSDEILIPVGQLLSDQIGDLFQELEKIFGNFERISQLRRQISDALYRQTARISDQVSRIAQALPSLDTWQRSIARGARKQCQKYEICYKLLYGLEKYGSGAIYDYFQWNSMRLLKESHRLVVATSGRVWLSLPSPQWLRDYKEEVYGVWQSIVASNPTLQSIVDTIEQLVREVTKDWEQIDGQEVKRAAKKLATIVFDVSAQRVVVWDPARGRFSLEIRSNGLRRQLRSIQTKNGLQMKKLSEFFV